MNEPYSHSPELSPHEEARLLDRLVDGELTEAERRELLTKFDSQSDGWRRCALAFLEAQAWGSEFRALSELPARPASAQPADGIGQPGVSVCVQGRWASLLAVAASFFLAFGLGSLWSGGEITFDETSEVAQVAEAPSHSPPAGVAQRDAPPPDLPQPHQPRQPEPRSLLPQWGTVTVSVDGDQDGVSESLNLPVASGAGIDETWLQNQPSALPLEVRRLLERMGHRVRHERQYLPFDLSDGRRIVVPVDEVDVQFVGDRQYQ